MRRFMPRISILFLALVAGLACEDATTAPAAVASQQPRTDAVEVEPAKEDTVAYASMTDRQLMITMLERLDALESRVEREAEMAQAQIETLLGGGDGGVGTLAFAQDQQKQRSRGTQNCFSLKASSEATFEQILTVLGNAFAGVGAWAGTGGTANLEGLAKVRAKVKPIKANMELSKSWCFGRSASRDRDGIFREEGSAGGASLRTAEAQPQAMENEIQAALEQFGITEDRASRALSELSALSSGLPSCRPRDCAASLVSALPAPPDLRGHLSNPEGFIRDRASGMGQFALDQLCADLFSGPFATRLGQACDLRDDVPDTQRLYDVFTGLDGLPDLVDKIDARLTIVCKRTDSLIEGANDFLIEKHGPFSANYLWPSGTLSRLGACPALAGD